MRVRSWRGELERDIGADPDQGRLAPTTVIFNMLCRASGTTAEVHTMQPAAVPKQSMAASPGEQKNKS